MDIYQQSRCVEAYAKSAGISLTWKEKLALLTADFLERTQIECPLSHEFLGGQYIRTIEIPGDTLFIGRPHKLGHHCQLLAGSIVHITEQGSLERSAPDSIYSVPGYQVVLYARTPVIGRTFHPDSGERDLKKIEEAIFESVDSIRELGLNVRGRLKWQA